MSTNKQELNEINVLLNKGFKIKVDYKATRYNSGFKAIMKPCEIVEDSLLLDFKEPTLAVLDLATESYLNLTITEATNKESNVETIQAAHRTIYENSRKMARIVAIFALGEDCFRKMGDRYDINEDEIERLTEIIFHWATPGKLEKIVSLCTALSNLPDFLNSIRLTGASRTTMPASLVE